MLWLLQTHYVKYKNIIYMYKAIENTYSSFNNFCNYSLSALATSCSTYLQIVTICTWTWNSKNKIICKIFLLKLKLQFGNKTLHVTIKKLHVIFFLTFPGVGSRQFQKNIKILNRVQSLFSITSKPPFFSFLNQHFPQRD